MADVNSTEYNTYYSELDNEWLALYNLENDFPGVDMAYTHKFHTFFFHVHVALLIYANYSHHIQFLFFLKEYKYLIPYHL